jgi:hypothetical protein
VIASRGGDLRELGGWDREGIARARGEDDIAAATTAWLGELGMTDRASLMAWCRERLEGKRDFAQVIAVCGWATWAGWISDADTVQALLLTGALAQRQYGSWDELGAATGLPITDEARALWATLPWTTPLEVTILEPPARLVLRGNCPHCSAPRVRPSSHAFVYCDYCGELADYDFVIACQAPRQPGPAYEALREQLEGKLLRARDLDDRDQYRELQLELLGTWLESTPQAAPVRTKLPEYRAQYIAWLAEAATTIAFDMEARRGERGMRRAVEKLTFAEVEGRDRVSGFPALLEAMSEFEARVDAISAEVYAMHPDHAPRELQRRIGFSQFAQAWLPFLGEDEATELLKRTMLDREYDPAGTIASTKWPCSQCGAAIELVDGAKRVCCDHCGRIVAVTG